MSFCVLFFFGYVTKPEIFKKIGPAEIFGVVFVRLCSDVAGEIFCVVFLFVVVSSFCLFFKATK